MRMPAESPTPTKTPRNGAADADATRAHRTGKTDRP